MYISRGVEIFLPELLTDTVCDFLANPKLPNAMFAFGELDESSGAGDGVWETLEGWEGEMTINYLGQNTFADQPPPSPELK